MANVDDPLEADYVHFPGDMELDFSSLLLDGGKVADALFLTWTDEKGETHSLILHDEAVDHLVEQHEKAKELGFGTEDVTQAKNITCPECDTTFGELGEGPAEETPRALLEHMEEEHPEREEAIESIRDRIGEPEQEFRGTTDFVEEG